MVRTGAAMASTATAVDSGSFEAFYASTYPAMVRLAWALVDQREIAEEATQDAYVALYGRFESVDHPAAYVRRSVVNNCRNIIRRRRVARRHDTPAVDAVDDVYDDLFDVIRKLPPRHREVVVLRYHAGLSDHDIATTLGVSAGTVKSRLSRAKAHLKKEIEP